MFSVSIPGDFTPHGVGITFVVWIAMLMRLPIDRVIFEAGRSFVHHGEVRLSTDEHDEMVRAEVLCVTQTNVTELFRSCLDARLPSIDPSPERDGSDARARPRPDAAQSEQTKSRAQRMAEAHAWVLAHHAETFAKLAK